MTSKTQTIPNTWKIFKVLYEILRPILAVVLTVCLVLSIFKPEEGSHSHIINYSLLGASAVLLMAIWFLNRYLERRSNAYVLYRNSVVTRLDLSTKLPLWLMILIVLIPFYILIITSLKGTIEANSIYFTWWPQKGFSIKSYKDLFTRAADVGVPIARSMVNSFVYAIIPTTVGLFMSALSAYAFAKLPFRGKKSMYAILIATMMMPGCVTMTTAYIMYDRLGWVNSALPLIIPPCFGAAATVMFLREFFMGIPNELLEAGRIDGAGRWRCFFDIILPLGKPALIAQFIMGFISSYNNYVGPLIYINNPEGYTIQIAINFLGGPFPDQAVTASAGVFAVVPMLLLYAIFQKRIVEGISMSSGIKG
ncbi:MAG: carbohydrate ABC transporter permease [Lachnospiraceae bacterium]|nr:carbohydrate ABC transporter permease [Lachnospiraceae bacterium]